LPSFDSLNVARFLNKVFFVESVEFGLAQQKTGVLSFFNSSSALATSLQAGNATAAITYTLPTAGPAASGYVLSSTTTGVLSWVNSAASFAPIGSSFVTIASDSTLTNERVLTGTANQVVITDNGANSTVVLSLPQSIATSSSPTFGGLTTTGSVQINAKGLGINTAVDVATGFAFGISVLGSTGAGTLELASARTDAANVPIGSSFNVYSTNSTNHKIIAYYEVTSVGATANQRGGRYTFYTKANGSTTITDRLIIDSADPYIHLGTDGDTTNVSTRVNGPTTTGASTATMTNSPVAGNPAAWITINFNGTNRQIPVW
jgi:hypothetical protein